MYPSIQLRDSIQARSTAIHNYPTHNQSINKDEEMLGMGISKCMRRQKILYYNTAN